MVENRYTAIKSLLDSANRKLGKEYNGDNLALYEAVELVLTALYRVNDDLFDHSETLNSIDCE